MKVILKNIFRIYQHLLFKSLVGKNNKPLLILDIDNTLADTWPSFAQKWNSDRDRHINLLPLHPVIKYVKSTYPVENYEWVFLTNRSYYLRKLTIKWLVNQELPAYNANVILVQNPKEKIELIKKYIKRRAIYFDDLTYNHEKGEVKFYSEVIQQCKVLTNIEYFGYDKIIEIRQYHD